MENVYELNNVYKTYKNDGREFTALKGVSLEVKEGEIFGIIGMSGAGKSTLVRTLNRLEEVTSGTVSFYGKDLASLKPAELREVRHSISMIFQGFNLLNQRTVIQNVEQSLKIIGVPRVKRRKKAEQMLEIVGLLAKRNEYPARLSGGQKQRVAIARALAADPKVLLCDEATSALDPKITGEILDLLNQRTVIQNVEQSLKIIGTPREQRRKKAEQMLEIVGLLEKRNEYPARLSGGQKQRVAIARALAVDPKVLLCDEATSALDPKITGEILDLLKKINEERKLTIIIITHEMAVVEKICDRVAIIDDGNLAEIGDVKEVFSNPKSKAAKKLVFPSNPFEASHPDGKVIRLVFDGTQSSVPFIANLVEKTGIKVNILSANTKSVGGIGYGQMIVELPESEKERQTAIDFFKDGGLSVAEVS